MCADGRGGAIIAWEHSTGEEGDVYVQLLDASGAAGWQENGMRVCELPGDKSQPLLVADGMGGALVFWWAAQTYERGAGLYGQRISPGGEFLWAADGVLIYANGSTLSFPKVIPDGSGGAIVVWKSRGEGDPVRGQRVNSNGVLVWPAGGVPVSNGEWYIQDSAKLDPDGDGGAFVTWRQCPDAWRGWDIYAQHFSTSGTLLWNPSGVPVCTERGVQEAPHVIHDGTGGAIIAWHDTRNSSSINFGSYDIYAQKVNEDGSPGWVPGGVQVCGNDEYQSNPKLIPDGEGGALVFWSDARSLHPYYRAGFFQRLNAAGEPLWQQDGIAWDITAPAQTFHVVSDGHGGALVGWRTVVRGLEGTYVQRLSNDSLPSWSEFPIFVTEYGHPDALTPDGSGGVILAWTDERNRDWHGGEHGDVYAERIDPLALRSDERVDLQVEAKAPGQNLCGTPFELEIITHNAGPDPATSVTLTLIGLPGEFLGSVGGTQVTEGGEEGSDLRFHLGALQVGESTTNTLRFVRHTSGTAEFEARVSSWELDTERYTNGHLRRIHFVTGPDLVPIERFAKRTTENVYLRCRQQCKLIGTFSIANQGNQTAPPSTTRFLISDDRTVSADDVVLKSILTGPISVGKSKRVKLKARAPWYVHGKYLLVVVDSGQAMLEAQETNNTLAVGPIH